MVKKIARSWGFHPRHLAAPPNGITPGKVITAPSPCEGAVPGCQALVPSFNACVLFILSDNKGNYHERPSVIHHVCLSPGLMCVSTEPNNSAFFQNTLSYSHMLPGSGYLPLGSICSKRTDDIDQNYA